MIIIVFLFLLFPICFIHTEFRRREGIPIWCCIENLYRNGFITCGYAKLWTLLRHDWCGYRFIFHLWVCYFSFVSYLVNESWQQWYFHYVTNFEWNSISINFFSILHRKFWILRNQPFLPLTLLGSKSQSSMKFSQKYSIVKSGKSNTHVIWCCAMWTNHEFNVVELKSQNIHTYYERETNKEILSFIHV